MCELEVLTEQSNEENSPDLKKIKRNRSHGSKLVYSASSPSRISSNLLQKDFDDKETTGIRNDKVSVVKNCDKF